MDVASELTALVAFKLIVFSFGTLVHLFLMVLILGQRRLRRLEWLLFALMAALFMWNSGNLLALNVGLFYGVGPRILSGVSRLIPFLGMLLSVPLAVHVHVEYARQFRPSRFWQRLLVAAFYLPVVGAPWLVGRLLGHLDLDPVLALRPLARPLAAWVAAALAMGAAFNLAFRRDVKDRRLASFHGWLVGVLGFLAAGLAWAYLVRPLPVPGLGGAFPTFLMLVAVVPSVLVGYSIFRYNFLDLRVQRNLIYSIVAVFALLIYLNGIRRLSGYLELHNILPSAVTEGVMIFILVVFLEPVKKLINTALHVAFVSQFAHVQRLSAEIRDFAKQVGDLEVLKRFVEDRVARELGLQRVTLRLGPGEAESADASRPGKVRSLPIYRGEESIGILEVEPVTSDLSGDQFGALQLLADQLPAALELCQLIADKVQLERALAEKAKMAFLGEMATRIAHNVKNPLSSMKTLVQVLEEDSSLPERVRQDCRLVAAEIDRLNRNISQVLRYAKPARDTDRPVDLATVVESVLTLARAEADRRQVSLRAEGAAPCPVEGGEEAARDIVSNLVVNALEASPEGGAVDVRVARDTALPDRVLFSVEDQGPGISPELREKIFQPFFTTRPGGTGLGLAIVARRAEEIGGEVECVSPLEGEGHGATRFLVRFRAGQTAPQGSAKESYALHPDRG
jgi:signal transduction histidine kinase